MRMTGVRTTDPSKNNPWKCWFPLVSRNLVRDMNGSLLKGADAGEEEGGMENDYWIRELHWRAAFHRLWSWSCR